MKNRYFITAVVAFMAITFLIGCQNEGEKNNQDAKDKIGSHGQMNNMQEDGMMKGELMDMPQMITNMKDMNSQMNSIMKQMNQNSGKMQHSKETIPFMNNMNDMGRYMNSMLEQMNQMMNNQEMMKDDKIHAQVNSMMENMNPVLNNYKEMMNHFSDNNKKN